MRLLLLSILVLGACHHDHDGRLDGSAEADGGDVDGGCPSNILCGASGACCDTGDECVDGACLPTCASGIRCATACCAASQVCPSDACETPTTACTDSFQCADTEFCEPTLDKCLPQPTGAALCEYKPPVAPYAPVIGWSWTASTIQPNYGQVINTPIVMDIDKDGIPDVVIVTSANTGSLSLFAANDPAYLRALDGKTGLEKWGASAGVYTAGNELDARATPAGADIDGDGKPEFVGIAATGGLIAFNADGSLRWKSTNADGSAYTGQFNSGVVAIADMNHDGKAEIVVGGVVLDYTGKVLTGVGREFSGTNVAGYGAVSILADVDGDGIEDMVTGLAAYKLDGTTIWNCGVTPFCGASAALTDGYTAIADFDQDGHPELAVISHGQIRIQDAKTGTLRALLALPGMGAGGPPTIADFDGDGKMDVASANGNMYNVFKYTVTPTPTITSLWSSPTQDLSSNVTGSSVFDFEGDGKAEVVYNDECFLRVFSGVDGTVKFQTPSSSATIHEFPILVDVDGDNHTELVVVSNDAYHLAGVVKCATYTSTQAPRHGVFVYRDSNDKWVRTRRLWNEHSYHVSNIDADNTLPDPELASWIVPPGLNNYRVSTQGQGVFNAPDLAVDLQVSTADCPTSLDLVARVKNQGSLGVAAGVTVDFYAGTDATGTHLGQKTTTMSLLPGASEVVDLSYPLVAGSSSSFFVTVDGANAINECNEANNAAGAASIRCTTIQ